MHQCTSARNYAGQPGLIPVYFIWIGEQNKRRGAPKLRSHAMRGNEANYRASIFLRCGNLRRLNRVNTEISVCYEKLKMIISEKPRYDPQYECPGLILSVQK